MAEVVNSLFGITPESLTAQRDQALQQEAMQYAKMDPFQRATAGIYSGANRLGGAIGGMLGAQDPEMMRMQQRQGMLQNLDLTNPESLKQGIQQAMQNKDYQLVSELTNRYQQRTAADLAARKIESEITKNTAEKKSFSVGDKAFLALAAKATPTSVKAAQDADNDIGLLDVPEAVKVSTYGQVLKDAGLKEGTPEFQKQMQAFAAAELESTRKGKGPKIDLGIGGVLEKFGAQSDAKSAGEAWAKAGDVYRNQVALIPKLDAVEKALPNTFTGSFSNAALQLGKAASAAGIPVDSAKLSNTEYLNSVTAQLVRTIARDFPGSQSNAELQQLLASKPSSAQEWDTIVRLLRDVKKEAKTSTKTYERMGAMPKEERYKTDFNTEYGKTFKDFNQKTNRLNELAQKLNSKTISDTEREEAKKLQEELR